MRQGTQTKILLNDTGHIIAISTGSDFCAEHEIGINPLQQLLCNDSNNTKKCIAQLRKRYNATDNVIGRWKQTMFGTKSISTDPTIKYPNLLEEKRIVQIPSALQFLETHGKTPEAIIAVSRKVVDMKNSELQFSKYQTDDHDINATAAWDEKSFAIRVRGKEYVDALREFYDDFKNKQIVFAGTFMHNTNGLTGGLILGNTKYFTSELNNAIENAQLENNKKLRLEAVNDINELQNEMSKLSGKSSPGYIWAQWKDAAETSLQYRINPYNGVKADYSGPYTREQLTEWAKSGYSTHLTNHTIDTNTSPSI